MATPSPNIPRRAVALGVALLLIACLVAFATLIIALRSRTPGDDSAEAGFARDMATHHAQAVEMSFLVRDRSSDEGLRTLAYDIIVTQSTQRGVFMGWLQAWGLPQSSTRPRMAWMAGHANTAASGGGPVLMHGMATGDEIARLQASKGLDAEKLFLALMIRHHQGGVVMARALMAVSSRDEVVGMAKAIVDTQGAEVSLMTEMLATRAPQLSGEH